MFDKATTSPAERKLDTPLRMRLRAEADRPVAAPPSDERVTVSIVGTVASPLIDAIEAAHGVIVTQSLRWGRVTASLPLASLLTIAARADVASVRMPPHARVN